MKVFAKLLVASFTALVAYCRILGDGAVSSSLGDDKKFLTASPPTPPKLGERLFKCLHLGQPLCLANPKQ
jgi:hypothetical protein